MAFRRLAKKDKFQPKKQEFVFEPGGKKNPLPKPDVAKVKKRRPTI